ncbi:flagellar motor switch protein FliN [Jannaschia sp. R86511]|uniref:flagellar motor switch protein FliN n=1 Tax=Jannaschia sp. R86511 TaxID=3093853 RepID=UPI0036D2D24B
MTSSSTARTTTTIGADVALDAARAAAGVLPLGGPVEPVTAPLSELDDLDSHMAVTARWSGAGDGTVAVLLSGADLLALSGGVQVEAESCRPALEAAAASIGPCTLGDLQTVSGPTLAEQLKAAGERAHLARLGDDPADAVHVAVVADPVAAAPEPVADLPAPRRAPGASAPAGADRAPALPVDGVSRSMGLLRGVHMEVTAEIGRTRLTVQELLELAAGSVVELDRPIGSPADLLVNGQLFARGEVVVVDEDFALRITEIVEPDRDVH